MKGDVLITKHFGKVTDVKDSLPLEEITGTVLLRAAGYPCLLVEEQKYDLPMFATHYAGQQVAILGRRYQKIKPQGTFNKILVVSIKRCYDV